MKTAILGGAFDPPHLGHVALAEGALGRLGADRLLVLVVAHPGHKRTELAPETRLELARLAFGNLPNTEIRLDEHAYTIDFLRNERPDDAVFVIGADEWAAFDTWREPEEIRRLIPLAVAARPGEREPEGGVEAFEIDQRPISSSDIRERIARDEPIDDLVPPAVAREIEQRGLYAGAGG
ncbi:MAG: nicotinate-nicotinamide nucleotide adenylyltransferase [Gaiellales bacterium]